VRGNTWKWVQDFLSKRTQKVLLDGVTSSCADVIFGIPQGTVMGPLLFLTFINDLPEHTTSDVRLFADDCLLYRQIRNDEDATALQKDLTYHYSNGKKYGRCSSIRKNVMSILKTEQHEHHKRTKGQTRIYNMIRRILKTEQHEHYKRTKRTNTYLQYDTQNIKK
jgi:hypothetical protein